MLWCMYFINCKCNIDMVIYLVDILLWLGPKLESMMNEMRQELAVNPPLAGAFVPKKGAKCVAQFTDGLWLVMCSVFLC